MDNIILYSNNCPRCKILKSRLDSKDIKYELIQDIDLMIDKGLNQMPVLEINRKMLGFKEAIDWINSI